MSCSAGDAPAKVSLSTATMCRPRLGADFWLRRVPNSIPRKFREEAAVAPPRLTGACTVALKSANKAALALAALGLTALRRRRLATTPSD
mmetsp:Transcript_30924/g.92944  ORF Transcript_30924/g.92944 Transcript_30924/m.92944 type:complete len:90 (+) Transcript_30924:1295-1564(+)